MTYVTNNLLATRAVAGPAALEMMHRMFVHGSNTFPPSLMLSSLTFAYIGYQSPEGLLASPYTYAGVVHFLGAPFTGVMVRRINHWFIDAAHVDGGDRQRGVKFLGGEEEARKKLVTFGRYNLARTALFGLGALMGLRTALLERC